MAPNSGQPCAIITWSSVYYIGIVYDSHTAPCRNHLRVRQPADFFAAADADGSGRLDPLELQDALTRLDVRLADAQVSATTRTARTLAVERSGWCGL